MSGNKELVAFSGVMCDVLDVDGAGSAVVSAEKEGPGTQILSGANSYTGGTVIRDGTLILEKGGTLVGEVQVKSGQFVDRNK